MTDSSPTPAPPSRARWAWIAFAVLVPVLGFAVAFATVDPAPPDSIRMATGPEEGAYHRHALAYKEALAKEGVELKLRSTRGTAENLELLQKGEVELAFVQGGVGKAQDFPQLRSLASLYYEPLWVFVRTSDRNLQDLRSLKGKQLAVGELGSGTRPVALGLLELNGVEATLRDLGGAAGRAELAAGNVDALFVIGSPLIELVRELLKDPSVRPLPFRRAEAYSRRVRYLSPITLPEGVIDLQNNVPAADVPLVATVASLAVRDEEFHPALTDLLLPIARRIHGQGGVLEEPGAFPNSRRLDYPLTDQAERYFLFGLPFLHRYLPFWAASLVSRFKVMLLPLLTLAIPLIRLLPPVYAWRQNGKVRKLYEELARLELDDASEEELAAMAERARAVPLPPGYLHRVQEFLVHLEHAQARAASRAGGPADEVAGDPQTGA
jgi:TRAP transporter TAXI family solute receptor